jgi:hypothetical protein
LLFTFVCCAVPVVGHLAVDSAHYETEIEQQQQQQQQQDSISNY